MPSVSPNLDAVPLANAVVAIDAAREPAPPMNRIPWECTLMVFAATCIWVGITWDISWHQTIGRDTFWTPAHVVIYVGGMVAGFCGAWLIFKASFQGTPENRAASVQLWGLRGPLGAWVAVWSATAMLVSAPFDDWWHSAYGLDVQILSPPHALLAAGMHHITVAALLLVASLQNRSAGSGPILGRGLFIYVGGVMLALASLIIYELSLPNDQHGAVFYQASAALYPMMLVVMARASSLRWAASLTALVYMGLKMLVGWILPLFAATPKLAPIYQQVDHMVPPAFPLLLIVPAIAVDLLFWALGKGRAWWRNGLLVITVSLSFVGLFLVTQWWFSTFLISPAADNWFFVGNRYWSFNTPPGDFHQRFWRLERNPVNLGSMSWALLWAALSTALGLVWGALLARVKR